MYVSLSLISVQNNYKNSHFNRAFKRHHYNNDVPCERFGTLRANTEHTSLSQGLTYQQNYIESNLQQNTTRIHMGSSVLRQSPKRRLVIGATSGRLTGR